MTNSATIGPRCRRLKPSPIACSLRGGSRLSPDADIAHAGVRRAVRFQLGLIMKLLVRVPLRQRNIRELQLSQASLAGHGDGRVDPALYGEGTQGGHAQGASQCV